MIKRHYYLYCHLCISIYNFLKPKIKVYYFCPFCLQFVLIFSWVTYKGYEEKRDKFPEWADALGWMMTMFVIVTIFAASIIVFCKESGSMGEVCIIVLLTLIDLISFCFYG